MTPAEKAQKLVDTYRNTIMSFLSDNMKDMNAKKCALIAVDEIVQSRKDDNIFRAQDLVYWEQVKQEINKL
jgi:methionine synthase II (cobalamin-independent)